MAHEQDLADLVVAIAEGREQPERGRPLVAAHADSITLRQLVRSLAEARGRSPLLFPVPWRLVFSLLRACERSGS